MKCKFCSAPLPKQGLICNYCQTLNPLNQKLLEKLEIVTNQNSHLCPCCNIALENIRSKIFSLEYCSKCDGILIDEDEFEKLIEYKVNPLNQLNPYYLRFIQDHPRDNRKKSQFHNCPICNEKMNIINYKKISGVLLDMCEEHGIWLDGGELRQIIDWYEVGGDKKIDGGENR